MDPGIVNQSNDPLHALIDRMVERMARTASIFWQSQQTKQKKSKIQLKFYDENAPQMLHKILTLYSPPNHNQSCTSCLWSSFMVHGINTTINTGF